MNLRHMLKATLLLALGLILHTITPSFLGMMKPDFMLCMMFISLYDTKKAPEALIIIVISGLLSGITSQMPYGLLSNFIDKLLTGFIIFKAAKKYRNKVVLTFIGTLISGIIFLSLSMILVPLDIRLVATLMGVHVFPAAIVNTSFHYFLHSRMKKLQY